MVSGFPPNFTYTHEYIICTHIDNDASGDVDSINRTAQLQCNSGR